MQAEPAKPTRPISFAREQHLVKLLMGYLVNGLLFMLLPGTFLGVWNLFAISDARSAASIPATWIQAHGHAQLFGWIGTFMLGIGFYSIPNVRRVSAWSFWDGWLIWAMWTGGVALRWIVNVYPWQWKFLLPSSAVLELLAVALFLVRSAQGHARHRTGKGGDQSWTVFVVGGTIGLLATMCCNAFESFHLAATGSSPAFPPEFDGMFLVLSIWGFTVPIAWGFTAHWMPVFLGLKPLRTKLMLLGFSVSVAGVIAAVLGALPLCSILLLIAGIVMVLALRIFELPDKPAKTQGVHRSFPVFMRIAYVWLLLSSLIAVWAAIEPHSVGIGGAGRHAITVGFLMTMVFTVAPRILPAFLGREKLFSERLMFLALLLTNTGCVVRVFSEILAYQQYATWAWSLLPVSATLEITGVVLFTVNMIGTFRAPPLLPQHKTE